jgi:CheY-like chemotaxis protein
VPPELLPTIFEPFVQGPRTFDRYQGGLGLGLALARNLARLHGGSLTFVRVDPHGSRFIVRQPQSSSSTRFAVSQGHSELVPTTKRRILVVDDNTDAGEMLKRALETLGHDVQVAASGEAALAMTADSPFDAAVLDIGLPGMNGFEVADRLRARYPHVRLIALTGYGQPADAEATRRAGFHAHCTKPVTISALVQHLEGAS